ncbi:hypothetical protein BN997_01120 [Oceanobacillus oncorhynchi]|uniref:DUF7210 domain-containing protein n=1 Tax=Oceanobacillus oncorhynchi TaxID=545501 RepID=A0A0A1MNV9_9BACI|nr:hypothetical protein [Oceanobacillus oncorhynchi]CEI81302.1 hypothetical protein BN997_01120 [Oceanobacillus oncorhynchi]
MPKYTAQAYLSHKGKIVKPGEELELTAKQADFLGDKVTEVKRAAAKTAAKKEEQKETK